MKWGEEFYKYMLENIYDGIYFVDTERKITFWNKGAERITGFSASEVVNSYCYDNILNHISEEGVKLCLDGCPLQNTIITGEIGELPVYLHHKEGHRISVTVKALPIFEGDKVVGAVEIFKDDSEKHNLIKDMEELKVLAMIDQLTGLPNRRNIDMHMFTKMNEFSRFGVPFGVAFIDIDYFKNFNDTYGHDLGDEVLKMVAKTLGNNLRNSDFVGRWGGEEFIAIFQNMNKEKLRVVSEKIRSLVENSLLRKKEDSLKVTISIGATISVGNDTIDEIIKRADQLLYKSKSEGRNRVSIG